MSAPPALPFDDTTDGLPHVDLPTRHGQDLTQSRRIAAKVFALLKDKIVAEPNDSHWREMGLSLLDGDVAADELVQWMLRSGMQQSRALFELALTQGIDAVVDAPAELIQFFRLVDTLPSWVDRQRLRAGAKACHIAGLTGMRVLRDLGLMAGYQASAINKPLIMTGTLQKGAQRRVAETTKWWIDVTSIDGLSRFGEGFKNTMRVRIIHALVRNALKQRQDWSIEDWGLPLNQSDLMATNLGFSVVFLIGQRFMGIGLSDDERSDFLHLWRTIGWLIGIEERWLAESEDAAMIALYRNLLSQAPPDESSKLLGKALMDEPLHRQYPCLQNLRGRYERAVHLSICRAFLGAESMQSLGLPSNILPWFPAVRAPSNWLWHRANRALPGGRERLARWGRNAQLTQLRYVFGAAMPEILDLHKAAPQTAAATFNAF
jgi:ER-bound oxygenase mpaB/B'/Rubber oxygenase, catalytic domain